MPDTAVDTPDPEPSVDEIVERAVTSALDKMKAEDAKLKADRLQVVAHVEEGDSQENERKAMKKDIEKALGIDKAYGRELHTCADPNCTNRDHGLGTARFLKLVALANRGVFSAMQTLDNLTVKVTGGMLETTTGVGGYVTPIIYETDLVPFLRAKAVVRGLGVPVFPMRERIHYLPRQSGAGTAYWLAEAVAVTASNQAFEQMTLTANDLIALTFFSNDLLMDSHPQIDQIVRDDLVQVMALAEDKAFLIGGSITSGSPTGIYAQSATNTYAVQTNVNVIHLTGGNAVTLDDLQNAIYQVRKADANFINCAWVMNPRDAYTLRKTKDADGRPLLIDANNFNLGGNQVALGVNGGRAPSGNLLGFPVWETTQMPTNSSLVATNAGSAIIFGDWSEALIGDRQQLEIAATSEATVVDPDGSTAVNLFATNQSAIRVVARLDFQLRHPKAFAVIDTIPA